MSVCEIPMGTKQIVKIAVFVYERDFFASLPSLAFAYNFPYRVLGVSKQNAIGSGIFLVEYFAFVCFSIHGHINI